MSLPHQSEPTPPRVGRGLDTAVDLLRRTRDGADIFPVPFLKGAISITCSILELIQMMRSNVEGCNDLESQVDQFLGLLETLAKSPNGPNMLTLKDSFQNDISKFESAMRRLEPRLKAIAKQNRHKIKRLLALVSNKNQLADIEKEIGKQLSFFKATLLVHNFNFISAGQKKDVLERFRRHEFELEGPSLAPNVYAVKLYTNSGASHEAIMKTYPGHIDQFLSERELFLHQLHPHLLQVFGESLDDDPASFLLLRSPGVNIQLKIEAACNDDQGEACSVILSLISVLSDAVGSLLREVPGGCLLEEADVYIKNNTPVLANWNPSQAYSPMASPEMQAQAVWDNGLVPLLSKSLTGNPLQANYVFRDDSLPLGRLVVQIVRSLVHFIWDYRRKRPISNANGSQETDLSVTLLQNFSKDIRTLNDDVRALRTSRSQTTSVADLLQTALIGRYSSWLCGIWDVWAPLDVEPGDVGYIKRGSHKLRPRFERLFNIADKVQDDPLPMQIIEMKHYPDAPGAWTSHIVGPELVRHTLHLDSLPSGGCGRIGIRRGWERASLNKQFDCSSAWKSFPFHARQYIEAMEADGKDIKRSELVLIFSYSGSQGYSFITPSGDEAECDFRDRLARDGYMDRLYYFETLGVREGQLQGYWSRSMEPGQPIWPPTADERGTSWGWEHVNFIPGLTVEVSRKGPREHIRYLHYFDTL